MLNQIRLSATIIIAAFASLAFFSCEKKIKSDQPPASVLTDERAVGKWEVVAFHVTDYRADTLFNISEYIKGFGQVENGKLVQGWIEQYHTTYLTLQSDHSFFHVDYDGNPNGHMLALFMPDQGGTWAVKSQSQIEMTALSFEDGVTSKQMIWNVAGYDGSYMNIEAMDTFTSYGAKAAMKVLLELERQ